MMRLPPEFRTRTPRRYAASATLPAGSVPRAKVARVFLSATYSMQAIKPLPRTLPTSLYFFSSGSNSALFGREHADRVR